MTNNEGGTDDEEFRNAAIVDRVNTTMAVWMGTSMACAQCHHHKYDPFSQKEYFQLFAILNNTEDADRSDETPLQKLYSTAQKEQLARARSELSNLDTLFKTGTPELQAAQDRWERNFPWNVVWQRTLGICAYPLTTPEADAQYADPSDSELKPLLRDSGQRSETERPRWVNGSGGVRAVSSNRNKSGTTRSTKKSRLLRRIQFPSCRSYEAKSAGRRMCSCAAIFWH